MAKKQLFASNTARPEIDEATGARYMRLDDVLQYDGAPGTGAFTVGQFNSQSILLPDPEEYEAVLEESTLSTGTLLGSEDIAHRAELQWRISTLLLIPVITLIAVPMSRVNPRQGRYSKLFPAAMIYVVYFVALEFCRDRIAEGGFSPAIGLWWIHAVFIAVGLFAMASRGSLRLMPGRAAS